MLRKTIQLIDTTVNRVVAFLCLILFLICFYAMVDAVNVYLNANDTSILKYKPDLDKGTDPLKELSPDCVAWLTVENTRIDYPVMQGKTNDTYINKDPYGDFSLSGSIFLDSRNSSDFSDDYSMVYGHHMEYGAMFGVLDEYIDPVFFRNHRKGTLITTSGKNYSINIFACAKAPASDTLIFNPTETKKEELLAYLEQNATIYEPEEAQGNDSILALSTCQSADDIERMIVFGTLSDISHK
ncbi:MAG: class B sortase [Eubacterium sp.]|nr:class B sortase [Eubacterium sp.]